MEQHAWSRMFKPAGVIPVKVSAMLLWTMSLLSMLGNNASFFYPLNVITASNGSAANRQELCVAGNCHERAAIAFNG
jgi:hypothetical protein